VPLQHYVILTTNQINQITTYIMVTLKGHSVIPKQLASSTAVLL